jgi:hypothetical protein
MISVPSGIRTDSSVPTSMITLPSINKTAFSKGTAPVPSTIRFALMAVCIARFRRQLRPITALGKPIGMISSVRRDHGGRYREHHENAWLPFCVYPQLARPLIKRDCRLRTIPTYGQNRGPPRPVLRMALHLATRPIRLLVLLKLQPILSGFHPSGASQYVVEYRHLTIANAIFAVFAHSCQ